MRQITQRLNFIAYYAIIRGVMTNYRKRIADDLLAEKLSYMGAVLVQGPKRIQQMVLMPY